MSKDTKNVYPRLISMQLVCPTCLPDVPLFVTIIRPYARPRQGNLGKILSCAPKFNRIWEDTASGADKDNNFAILLICKILCIYAENMHNIFQIMHRADNTTCRPQPRSYPSRTQPFFAFACKASLHPWGRRYSLTAADENSMILSLTKGGVREAAEKQQGDRLDEEKRETA